MTNYALHNVSRHVGKRTQRAQAATALRKKHYVGDTQMRLVPARPLIVSEEVLLRNLEDIRKKAAQHILEVRTMDGRVVDLNTLQAGPGIPAPLQPHPKLDSVADDIQVGQYIPPYVGEDGAMPQILPHGEKPELLKQAEVDFELSPVEAPVVESAAAAAEDANAETELDAAIAQAQAAASEEPPAAPEQTSEEPRKGKKRNR